MSDFHWDYEVFLFLGTVVALLAWVTHKAMRRKQADSTPMRALVSVGSFFPILFLILSVRSFAFEPFRIPSSSMMPTLLTGDFIWVDKSAYGLKMPVLHNTLIETGHPERGDVFVFRSVEDPSVDVIKRVIGVPGDHVKYNQQSKQVYINGKLLPAADQGLYLGFHDDINPDGLRQISANTDGKKHNILHSDRVHRHYQFTELVVPDGHYFGLGDNRDFSADSRVFGLIPEQNVVGQAKFIWMHWRPQNFVAGLKRVGSKL